MAAQTSPQEITAQVRQRIVDLARQGGYLDAVLGAGPELDRMKHYLRMLMGQVPAPPARPEQSPTIFPPFPGLDEHPWRDPPPPAAKALEGCLAAVTRDLERLENADLLHYDSGIVGTGHWSVHPIFFGGERTDRLFWPQLAMEETASVVRSLDGECTDFPLADVLFSSHAPGTTLTPHCSWDGFRMRLHLGLKVPEGCGIRVGSETRHWQPGRVLTFHDSFEHETWNRGTERRVVLIADCWHPGLTLPEREALLGLTRKFEVRAMLARLRVPEAMSEPLLVRFAEQERTDAQVRHFWRG
ncbi:aspartyl/asparaginyl beta-hydroxylase domain-containing protein [Corallococcus sp. AS-1-12]|uniref:aspartyl/asparaginyl beta-hydroxylase domain-containing protein n=1 Tax=Corallococcus sp. AS-1-12 TaxID=2874598 RepID=UPI001CC19A5B|nr:aspartyl/asparaginyl beta-hydroxylase domain-containing protein [Corallococcus sp. AS-1-12]MBZ4332479.1 aspartyl/asparaginyl beta-hydroxylase domain-containing protein [Corallococcus sp. AS-1-12]